MRSGQRCEGELEEIFFYTGGWNYITIKKDGQTSG